MGWINFIVIPKWKALIPVTRYADELPEYLKKTLDELIYGEEYAYDLMDTNVKDLDLHTLQVLLNDHDTVEKLKSVLDADVFLLYWLETNKIQYKIISEYEYTENKKQYKDYKILPTILYDDEEE